MRKKTVAERWDNMIGHARIDYAGDVEGLKPAGYLETVKTVSRLMFACIYVIDYRNMEFEFVSESPLLGGFSAAEVKALGFDWYRKYVPADDLGLLTEYAEKAFDFFERLPEGERTEYTLHYDFHLVGRNGKPMLIHHKLTPLMLTKAGRMWKSLCSISVSPYQQAGNCRITKAGADVAWKFIPDTKVWQKFPLPVLSDREMEVLRLYAQGLTINEIAERVSVSPDTVKYYRRRIFEALDVNSVVEALGRVVG